MNNKGFMMAEVVVVASIVLVTLVGFYTSYNKIISVYNQRVSYYDVATLYELANIREGYTYEQLNAIGSTGFVENEYGYNVYYLDKSEITDLVGSSINPTFGDYLTFLSTSVEIKTNSLLVMEKCDEENNNCKYAYLEVCDS